MTIHSGARFGSYEILAPLGAGGMGEVYRGFDSRLGREVAIKMLPRDRADDPERLSRLTREARLLASLSHPNIASIFSVEERGEEIALVLELIEGPTLAERLAGGPLSVKTALPIALQIAQALEAAHARGIIHRDLKPANLKTTPDGRVKVLDFGVGKIVVGESTGETPARGLSATTQSGVVLGTPGYMSPEQATGGEVDRRADVWAFGCVLFEMLSGRRPFAGATPSESLVRALEHEPEWDALPRDVSPRLASLIDRCLRKDAHRRLQDIGDARVEIEELIAGVKQPAAWSAPGRASRRRPLLIVVLALAALGATGVASWVLANGSSTPSPTLRVAVVLPPGVVLPMETEHPVLALSPDGKELVFVGEEHGVSRLYRRRLSDADARPIAGTEGAAAPFFSTDGAWIGFVDGSILKRVPIAGGLPSATTDITGITVNRGVTAFAPDSVVVAMSPNSGLSVQAIVGGRIGRVTDWQAITNDTMAYAWPNAVPGEPYLVFADNKIADSPDKSQVSLLDRHTRAIRPLVVGGTNPVAPAADRLLFVRGGSLYSVSMDVRRARVGAEERLIDSVVTEPGGAAHVAVSAGGTLAYVSGPPVPRERELVWVDREGRVAPLFAGGRDWSWPRLSPDGGRLAVSSTLGANTDLHVLSLARMTPDRVTTDPGEDFGALWSPDGARLAFSSEQFGAGIGPQAVVQSGADNRAKQLFAPPTVSQKKRGAYWSFPTSWTPDGKWIACTTEREGNSDVVIASATGSGLVTQFAANPTADEYGAAFSPDGAFIAYVSNESGDEEIFVQPFPGPGRRVKISTNGGTEPLWNRKGLELFYRQGDALMSVRFDHESALEPRAPTVLFSGHFDSAPYGGREANYDVSPDGTRFVFVRRERLPRPTVIQLITNWPRGLGVTRSTR